MIYSNNGPLLSIRRNELLSHDLNPHGKCILLNESNQSKNTTHCMSPTIFHSAKGENYRNKKIISGRQELGRREK